MLLFYFELCFFLYKCLLLDHVLEFSEDTFNRGISSVFREERGGELGSDRDKGGREERKGERRKRGRRCRHRGEKKRLVDEGIVGEVGIHNVQECGARWEEMEGEDW